MNKKHNKGGFIALLFLCNSGIVIANPNLPKMTLMGIFDSGQPSSVIIKLYDENEDIFCYVLMPENAVKKQISGVWTYEGNNIGSISCVAPARRQINFDLKRK